MPGRVTDIRPEYEALAREVEAAGVRWGDIAQAMGRAHETVSRWLHGKLTAPPDLEEQVRAALPEAIEIRKAKLREELDSLNS